MKVYITENMNASMNKICRAPGSNRGPLDLQSNALPTELSRLLVNWGVQYFVDLLQAAKKCQAFVVPAVCTLYEKVVFRF